MLSSSLQANDNNNSSNDVKYGDGDQASKKRKDNHQHNTVFTKRLPCHLAKEQIDLDGSVDVTDHHRCENNDEVESDDEWIPSQPISINPSSSSCGFENTFKILEGQLGKQKLSRKQIELLLRTSDIKKNPIFIDVPITNKERFLRAISEEKDDSIFDESDVDESPSFLELELGARQRIKELSAETSVLSANEKIVYGSSESMNEFVHGINSNSSISSEQDLDASLKKSVLKEDITQFTGDYPEYVYHVAKGKDGRLYLRVVRSLLVDKGNIFYILCFSCHFHFKLNLYNYFMYLTHCISLVIKL